jgi:hypothetical protein
MWKFTLSLASYQHVPGRMLTSYHKKRLNSYPLQK